ncbi:hypothetical protein AARI_14570 [Glutamicibacter arilaitensis Re117]|uniref:Sugar phosphotransferase n=1 Tax=Glutamicibacter arilaitensis (strain DSM 16368 / CIP 108037 / IAM 15318 / JCM 13566 / NCIMB 14258 / Re117) TaxID=861360 RepID=A0ABP1U4J6_GLUAR|nr:hypothetical protein AARI_14570 [Glutamicibacter arilaitensis Re117]
MLAGWRGRIGRAVPESIISKVLERSLAASSTDVQRTAPDLRRSAEHKSIEIASRRKIDFSRASKDMPLCVAAKDWQSLRRDFEASGMIVRKLHGQHSFAASEAWSVGVQLPHSESIADLRGAGAIWQVFPGLIKEPVDVHDFGGTVDAVYTWVDAEDLQWASAYQDALGASGREMTDSSVNRARFQSHDELRYSLRSLELNLPWINKIHLVTAGQRPSWLVKEHPKLVLVDHQTIFNDPESDLPTFNSHAIESQLVNIPNLAEHFLYVNDDVFFGRYLYPNAFFGPAGQAKYSLSSSHFAQAEDPGLPVNQAAVNNRNVVVERFGRTSSHKFRHVAHPQRLSVHRQLHEELEESIARVAANRFRSENDLSIPSSLVHQFAAQMGMGYPSSTSYRYIDIGSKASVLELMRLSRDRGVDMFCINEVLASSDADRRSVLAREILASKFPLPSTFELSKPE